MLLQIALFVAFSLLCSLALLGIYRYQKISIQSLMSLFCFGLFIAAPFLLIEYLHLELKFYVVLLVFIAIELTILLLEEKISYFHKLIHHNIKELRIVSFFLIGLGFTYGEIVFTIFTTSGGWADLMHILPFKIVYALIMHTVFASAVSLVNLGSIFAETIYEMVFKLLSYYVRLAIISASHYLYVLSLNYDFLYLMTAFLFIGLFAFFYLKKKFDEKILEG